ncbi:transposase [Thiomicrorhabdus sp.]|uniref:transposase n=1 Tax=Thiomicrorhabdus sp. TaxID=2039724 RepID=UPI0029C65F8E|nr:transposase [Thiomicrorhabdus sp.]
MTNHVHLLCAGMVDEEGIGKMMQSLGRQYVRYFNQKYNRTGTLWEGRFKSCLVEADNYLFELYRYIELNPVRAKMVEDPAEYIWSSYQINALERVSELLTPHSLYLQLGKSAAERKQNYRKLFEDALRETVLEEIRQAINRGMAVGSDRFKDEIEVLTGRRLKENKRGRPVGWRKLDNRKI